MSAPTTAERDALARLAIARVTERAAGAELARVERETRIALDAARLSLSLAIERRHADERAAGELVNARRRAERDARASFPRTAAALAAPARHEYESERGASAAVTPCAVCGLSRRSAVHS
jgi:hypothetical protein